MLHGAKVGYELTNTEYVYERVCTCWGIGNYEPTSRNVCACMWRVGV